MSSEVEAEGGVAGEVGDFPAALSVGGAVGEVSPPDDVIAGESGEDAAQVVEPGAHEKDAHGARVSGLWCGEQEAIGLGVHDAA